MLKRLSISSNSDVVGGAATAASASATASPTAEAKQVMFSDGIRPGGDLTDLDGSSSSSRGGAGSSSSSTSGRKHHRRHRRHHAGFGRNTANVGLSMIPIEEHLLPPLSSLENEGDLIEMEKEALAEALAVQKKEVVFQINKNLVVKVKLIKCETRNHFYDPAQITRLYFIFPDRRAGRG